jgi:methyl-accepting chemotaxis protein
MDEMTQQNAALAEESAASAGALTGQIETLNQLVAAFRTNVGQRAASAALAPAPVPAPVSSEPDRLRRLAAEAFEAPSATAKPARSPRRPAKPLAEPKTAAPRAPAPNPPARRKALSAPGNWEEF